MVNVARVGSEDRHTAQPAAQDGHGNVEQRNGECEQRNGDEHRGGALDRTVYRQHREHEADEEASGIAQEDAGGAEVVACESDQRADEHERDRRDLEVAESSGGSEHGGECDDRDAGGESIETIDEIERVRDGDDPETS